MRTRRAGQERPSKGGRGLCQCGAVCACGSALLAAIGAAVAIALAGDGAGNGPTPTGQPYKCDSNLFLGSVVKPDHKGLAIDDTTFQKCSSRIPRLWPNTQEKLTSIRLFKAWDKEWPDGGREEAWAQLVDAVKSNGVKVLVGTQITCDEQDDDRDWRLVKMLLQRLGKDHVMGVAVGNELELLQFKKDIDMNCVHQLWGGGYFFRKLTQRAADLDALDGGFSTVPLTTVFGGYILSGDPFVDEAGARCATLLRDAVAKFGKRWVFTLNIYPYFDPNNVLDSGTTDECTKAITTCVCFDNSCNLPATVSKMRSKMQLLTGTTSSLLWIGETGWSSPQAATLAGSNPQMAKCPDFSSSSTLRKFYSRFLKWDLSISSSSGPDHVFYFTARDSGNFGVGEHFGLISDCDAKQCKLQSNSSLSERASLAYV